MKRNQKKISFVTENHHTPYLANSYKCHFHSFLPSIIFTYSLLFFIFALESIQLIRFEIICFHFIIHFIIPSPCGQIQKFYYQMSLIFSSIYIYTTIVYNVSLSFMFYLFLFSFSSLFFLLASVKESSLNCICICLNSPILLFPSDFLGVV